MAYSEKVIDHYENPRNVGSFDNNDENVGSGMVGAPAKFMGIDLVNEKELVLIVARTSEKNQIMKSIMDGADKKAGAIVFSLPVTDTAGLRLLDED